MKTITGEPNEFKHMVLGIITKRPKFFKKNYIFLNRSSRKMTLWGYRGIISAIPVSNTKPNIVLSESSDWQQLNEGDIATLDSEGKINVIWDSTAFDNSLLITERCNCNCIMCPQPPKTDEEDLFDFNRKILRLLKPDQVKDICITGGEPTISKEKFLNTLKIIQRKFPEAHVNVLTNAKKLSDFDFVKSISELSLKNLMFCISIHGDTSDIHDSIVRVPKSFEKTVMGIQNLAIFRQKIELRFVVTKINHSRLLSFSDFVYKNFPFVLHVAFMAQEISGLATKNFSDIWIDPMEYRNEITKAVNYLHQRAINTSIYNVPLCLLPSKAWPFARKSISSWKNIYLEQCNNCIKKMYCCGVFSTSSIQSENIMPFLKIT